MKTTLTQGLKIIFLLISIGLFCKINAQTTKELKLKHTVEKKLLSPLISLVSWQHLGKVSLDSVVVNSKEKKIRLHYNKAFENIPIREDFVEKIDKELKRSLGRKFRQYNLEIYIGNQNINTFVPNAYRSNLFKDNSRIVLKSKTPPLIQNTNKLSVERGLEGNYIALWHSHGWYYEASLDRWEWQRARLFGMVEDMGTMSYVLPYLVPMLENAGALTFLPRERSCQLKEVIVDNDYSTQNSQLKFDLNYWKSIPSGFKFKDTLFNRDNPFTQGSYLACTSSVDNVSSLRYIPLIPENGYYPVYISWGKSEKPMENVEYTVNYAGGSTRFLVNQTMGGSTWQYLGTFFFEKGMDPRKASVEVSNYNTGEGIITSDAIRFGGGKGNVARRVGNEVEGKKWSLEDGQTVKDVTKTSVSNTISWKQSGRSRHLEAARYYLQWAGIPSSVYSLTNYKNDYNDDYQSRGEWVNYLLGVHKADSIHPEGLNIPIDLAFAFHTDAGITSNDSIIGTLGIYSTTHTSPYFENGQSKMASRDLTDLIQTQITEDIRKNFNPKWTRRAMWDKTYSEAWRPQVPTMLLELLSHQNLADMKFALDPRFRFAVSRSIYKGMLRYLATQENREYIVQPLPPRSFAILKVGENRINLRWKETIDSLEPSAMPTYYKIYKRKGGLGFDNGTIVNSTETTLELEDSDIYSFYVTACNDGGESMPGEILAACLQNNVQKPILIVNGFTRISAPSFIDNGTYAGIAWWDDQGVADRYDIAHVGNQYDYNRKSPWLDDDSPGWGASNADMEEKIIPGNTFDFTFIHGKAIAGCKYSFISMSREYFENNSTNLNPSTYFALDLIMGEQRSVPQSMDPSKKDFVVFSPQLLVSLDQFISNNVNILLSGAYIGTDMVENKDSAAIRFIENKLHYKWRTNHADKVGTLRSTDYVKKLVPDTLKYNSSYHPSIYTVEAPDAIEASGPHAHTIFRYKSNNTSAGVLFNKGYKSISLGFPFESLIFEDERTELMKSILKIFNQ